MLKRSVTITTLLLLACGACGHGAQKPVGRGGSFTPLGAVFALPQGSSTAALDRATGDAFVVTETIERGTGAVVLTRVDPSNGKVESRHLALPHPDAASSIPMISITRAGNVWLGLHHDLVRYDWEKGSIGEELVVPPTTYDETDGSGLTGIVALQATDSGLSVLLNRGTDLLTYAAHKWTVTSLPFTAGRGSAIATTADGSRVVTGAIEAAGSIRFMTAHVRPGSAEATLDRTWASCHAADGVDRAESIACVSPSGSVGRFGGEPIAGAVAIATTTNSLRLVRADSGAGVWSWAADVRSGTLARTDTSTGETATASFPAEEPTRVDPSSYAGSRVNPVPPGTLISNVPELQTIVPLSPTSALVVTGVGYLKGNINPASSYSSIYLASL